MAYLFQLFITLAALNLGGCAAMTQPDAELIKRYDYSYAAPKLEFALHAHLIVVDLRPEIISRHKEGSYVGNAFSVFGNPVDVVNADGCQMPHTTHTTERCLPFHESVYKAILRQGGNTSGSNRLFVIINQWKTKTDAHDGIKLTYDLAAIVEDKEKQVLAKNHIMGTDESIDISRIGTISFSNHTQAAEEMGKIVSSVLARKLETLLGGDVANALQRME
jgi:hypothetical protein